MSKERLILNVTPDLLVATNDGSLKVAFFDKKYKINIKRDKRGKELSSDEEVRLYIHIQNLKDKFSVVVRRAGEKKVIRDDEVSFVPETVLFSKSYNVYLKAKSAVVVDHASENEALILRIAELEAKAPKSRAKKPKEVAAEEAPKSEKEIIESIEDN